MAAVTASVGALAIRRCAGGRELPLAGMPVLFAFQQAVEGGIWLHLLHPADALSLRLLTDAFTGLALVVWPLLVPVATLLLEPEPRRRRLQLFFLMAGLIAAAYSAWDIAHHPYTATITGNSICYINNNLFPLPVAGAYVLAAGLPLLTSSHAAVRLFGLIVIAGMILSLAAYYLTFVSVWCFFAAGGSVVLYGYFRGEAVRAATQ